MAQFTVDSEMLMYGQGEVAASADRLRTEVAFLMGRVTQLESSWQGGASAGFQALVAQWQALHLQVEDALASLGQRLGAAGTGYRDVEDQITRMMAY
ncbi:WXG100 family type VII secretion target [Microbacterium indicum]|uniref:WXG100 family type VII secretion target n=1 Tax=Microbacterium indicum TaxID=358100 RepID=UPI000420E7A4|nr:WXG100 family type VII secretion target [Microbacterium indicum]